MRERTGVGVANLNEVIPALLPTPQADDSHHGHRGSSPDRASRRSAEGRQLSVSEAVALLPTPSANQYECALEVWQKRRARLAAEYRDPAHPVGNGNGFGLTTAMAVQELALLKTPTAQLAVNGGSQHPDKRTAGGHGPTLADQVEHDLLPTPSVALATGGQCSRSGDRKGEKLLGGIVLDVASSQIVDWGKYARAILRWQQVLGTIVPHPLEPGTRDGGRLSAAFVEWMMGLPSGRVTEVPGLARKDHLKILGNGVVPQQARLALCKLLARAE